MPATQAKAQNLKKAVIFSELVYYVECPHCGTCQQLGVEGDQVYDDQPVSCENGACKRKFMAVEGHDDD